MVAAGARAEAVGAAAVRAVVRAMVAAGARAEAGRAGAVRAGVGARGGGGAARAEGARARAGAATVLPQEGMAVMAAVPSKLR